MRKIKYGGYIEDTDIIKVCNEMNIYDITKTNIFRSNQFGGTRSVIVLYDNNIFYLYRDLHDNLFRLQTTHFDKYDLNSKPQDNDNFDDLSDQDKHHLFHDYDNQMQIYENKEHPDILFALSAFNTACCIVYDKNYDIIDIDLGEKVYKEGLYYY